MLIVTHDLPRDGGAHSPTFPLGGLSGIAVHKIRNTLGNVRKVDEAGVREDLRRIYAAENTQQAQMVWGRFRERWGGFYPAVAGSLETIRVPFVLSLLSVVNPARTTGARSFCKVHLESMAGSKGGDHRFPSAETVEKLMNLECNIKRTNGRKGCAGSWTPKSSWRSSSGSGTLTPKQCHRLCNAT